MDQPATGQVFGEMIFRQSYLISMTMVLATIGLVLWLLGC